MKLAAHYNKATIIISVSVLLASGIIYFIIINHIGRKQLDNNLAEEVSEVIDYVNLNKHLPKQIDFDEDLTSFAKTNLHKFTTRFFDTPYANPREKKVESGRAVSALITVNHENYIVTIVVSSEETEYLIQIISGITLFLTAVLLSILIFTNMYVLRGLWRPFYFILEQVKWFNVADTKQVEAVSSAVDEFRELSDAVSKMSSRVTADYQGLKAFTENASHEMMTPLAVITSKLDMLIQDETLGAEQFSQITDIYAAASKLSRLNQSLLLLVKIENNLLQDREILNVRTVILEKASQFQEMLINKKIELTITADNLEVNTSRYLMDVLINNLFSNAIRHNKVNGDINISLFGKSLIFQNSGELKELDAAVIFDRFFKGKTSDGTGLGLAIMKNICNKYDFECSYSFINAMHTFRIEF